jgi:hypothetical protein
MLLGSRAWPAHRADNLLPSVNQLSRQCGILNALQLYRPPQPVMWVAELCTKWDCIITCVCG